MKKIFFILVLSFALVGCQQGVDFGESQTKPAGLNNNSQQTMDSTLTTDITKAVIKTNLGNITVEFYNQDAVQTVANFVKLAQAGFYDGTKFHRVIKDFMIQGGDPLSKDDSQKNRWGTGGPGYVFNDEINNHQLVRGSLAMANAGANTNGSQFFIVTAPATAWLDGHHTNFGQVISGMDVVDKIENSQTDSNDRPVEDVIIESIELQ
ncbi:MAG: peptidylprolyl isomerase [Patescibacteria group bacterium]|jgi:peptidyl-prolyl cis-trans isomerase B (cyclophilin B)|nr:peptidylprolyl isomerase [Patescibacteria group bacterium]